MTTPPGRSASAHAVEQAPGLGQVDDDAIDVALGEAGEGVARRGASQFGASPWKRATLSRARAAKSSRSSYDVERARRADGAQQRRA